MKSLAKIVAMGLVMSSVPVMGAWAEDLKVTTRDQWDWKAPGYTYNAYHLANMRIMTTKM